MTDFPDSANTGDIFSSSTKTYEFDGEKWKPITVSYYTYGDEITANANNEIEINLNSGNYFICNIVDDSTITFTNPPQENFAQSFEILLSVDNSQGNTAITWDSDVYFENITPPSLANAQEKLLIEFVISDTQQGYFAKVKERDIG